jgi:hypothetical protein
VQVSLIRQLLAEALRAQGRLEDAQALLETVVAHFESEAHLDPRDLGYARCALVQVLAARGLEAARVQALGEQCLASLTDESDAALRVEIAKLMRRASP